MKKNGEIIVLKYDEAWFEVFYRTNSEENFQRLTTDMLARKIPGFHVFIEDERQKRVKEFLAGCTGKWSRNVNILDTVEDPTAEFHELQEGALLFLKTPELFEDPETGYRLAAMALSSARCKSLQDHLQDFQPVLFVRTHAADAIDVITDWVYAVEPRQKWARKKKRPKVYRTPVLDYRDPPFVGWNLLDFNRASIKFKKEKVRAAIPYDDILIVVIGADVKQLHELAKYVESAGLILINSSKAGYEGNSLTDRHLAAVDDELIEQILKNFLAIASVFDKWRCGAEDENAWAAQIARNVKASFGKPDSRYRSVVLDPIKLQDAVLLEVLRSFGSFVVDQDWVTQKDTDNWVAGAVEVFAPKPKETQQVVRIEDPEVFLEFVNKWYHNPKRKLAGLEENFSRNEQHDGAIRKIGDTTYLVLPEEWLSKTFLKEARKLKYNCDFAAKPDWMQKIQKEWCKKGILKHSKSGYRYRYDLLKNDTRDTTYVLAIPLEKIE